MRTAERAGHIAEAAAAFPILGNIASEALLALVEAELGHAEILDDFQTVGEIRSKAIAPRSILHVISGNTPHAGLQSLIRGILLGSENRCKIPAAGLPEIEQFRERLPGALAGTVLISSDLSESWIRTAGAVIAFGSDETIRGLRKRFRPDQKFMAHGHRISFGILYEEPDAAAAELAARDASLFDQQGCLSPHLYYAGGEGPDTARRFAAALAIAMEAFDRHTPRRSLDTGAANEIRQLRSSYQFRAANDAGVQIWCSEGSTAWTVIYEDEPQFAVSPLNRVVFVKPLPENLEPHLALVRTHLSSISVWPFREEYSRKAASEGGSSRICALGSAQNPSLFWHQDGLRSIAPLVTWIDLG